MKIKILMGLLAFSLLIASARSAQAAVTIVPTVESLQALVVQLQQQLQTLLAKQSGGPRIVMVTPPTKVTVGKTAFWKFKADRLPTVESEISYQTGWGDSDALYVMKLPAPATGTESISFNHNYQKPGRYTQTFTILAPSQAPVSTTTAVYVTR
jgi:hypothetical protein